MAHPERENSLWAVDQAAKQGADGIEIDVRQTRDGTWVVCHDTNLHRQSDGAHRAEVAAELWKDLKALPFGNPPAPLARLHDVLTLAADLGLAVNIELKADQPMPLAEAVALPNELGPWLTRRTPRLWVSSFSLGQLRVLRQRAPNLPRALIAQHQFSDHEARAVDPVAIHLDHRVVTAGLVARWRHRGVQVAGFTVNTIAAFSRCRSLGLNGVISDHPRQLRAWLNPSQRRHAFPVASSPNCTRATLARPRRLGSDGSWI